MSESMQEARAAPEPEEARRAAGESIMDNLGAWAVIAAAVAFLFMVWATVRILTEYVGSMPGVGP